MPSPGHRQWLGSRKRRPQRTRNRPPCSYNVLGPGDGLSEDHNPTGTAGTEKVVLFLFLAVQNRGLDVYIRTLAAHHFCLPPGFFRGSRKTP